jgi:hypothetical protein
VAWHAIADDLARFHIQCCEQRGRAVPLIIVCHHAGGVFSTRRSCARLLERQTGLGSIKGLDLGLLIDAQHDSAIWRVKVKSHDISYFLFEERIVRDFEPLRDMRFEAGFRPFGGKSIPRIDF